MPQGATDWLRSIGQDPDARSEPLSEPLSTPEDQSGIPEWLRDLSADEVARGIEAEAPESQPHFDPQAPGWLAQDEPAPDASTVSAQPEQRPPAADEPADEVPSWLREAPEPGADEPRPRQPEAAADLAGGAEMPAWLRDLGEQPAAPEEPAAEDEPAWLRAADRPPTDRLGAAEDDVPAWLRGDDEAAPQASDEAPSAGDDEMPSWLRESAPPPPQPTGSVAPPPPPREGGPAWLDAAAGGDEVPAWLQGPQPEGGAPPAAGGDEVPAWLQEPGEPPPPPPPASDVPAWLQDEPATPAASDVPAWLQEPGEPPPSPPAASDVPAWLQDEPSPPAASDVPAWLQEPGEPLPPPPAASDVPAWLAGDERLAAEPGPGGAADPGLPSWLRGVEDEPLPTPADTRPPGPPAPPRRAVPSAEPGESHSFLSGAELPAWLRVPEPERPGDPSEGQALDWLRRLGSPEQEEEQPAAVAVTAPQRPEYRRSAEQLAAVSLLQQIRQAPYPQPAAPAAPAPLMRWQRIGLDRVLYALLAVALVVALLVPTLTAPFQTATPAAPGAAELGALLDGLGPDDVALVAYEWGAQRSGELRPLEAAVTSRLIANRVKLILVSTDLQGTLLSFDLIGPLRAAGYNTEGGVSFGGRDYVLLGYRPGGELALRGLAQDLRGQLRSDFDGQDATQGLVANNPDGTPRFNTISDLSMIVVMADQPQDVQAWMEQVRPAAREVPMVFLLPQEAQPLAQPFLRLRNVYHAAGQQGALALSAGAPASDPIAVAQAGGQLWFAVAAFLVLLALGAVAAVAGRRPARGGGA